MTAEDATGSLGTTKPEMGQSTEWYITGSDSLATADSEMALLKNCHWYLPSNSSVLSR